MRNARIIDENENQYQWFERGFIVHSSSQGLIRLWIVGLLLLLTLLTACSGQGEKASRASGSEGVPGAAAPSASAISNAAPAAQPVIHKFKHVMGEIEWSTPPKRVVGIYTEDFLLALGVKPVTQTVIGNFSLKYLLPEIGNLPKLDTSAISFEAALQAEPDLFVLGFANYGAEGRYEKFSKIAPTYVLPADAPNNWRDTLRTIGELVGKPEEADKVLKQYSEKVAAAKKTLETSVGRETVALVRIRSNKEIRLYGGPQGYSGSVLYQDLGLEPPAIVKKLSWGESGEPFRSRWRYCRSWIVSISLLPSMMAGVSLQRN